MSETTTIRIHKNQIGNLKLLCRRSDKNQVDYISRAVEYLRKNSLDIFDEGVQDIPGILKNLDKRIISFLKQREKDFFIPMNQNFLEQSKILNAVLLGMENFDLVNWTQNKQSTTRLKSKEDALKIAAENNNNTHQNSESQIQVFKDEKINVNDEEFLLEIDKLKTENEVYRTTIKYLLENIKPGGALSGAKYTIDISKSDIQRIENLL